MERKYLPGKIHSHYFDQVVGKGSESIEDQVHNQVAGLGLSRTPKRALGGRPLGVPVVDSFKHLSVSLERIKPFLRIGWVKFINFLF